MSCEVNKYEYGRCMFNLHKYIDVERKTQVMSEAVYV